MNMSFLSITDWHTTFLKFFEEEKILIFISHKSWVTIIHKQYSICWVLSPTLILSYNSSSNFCNENLHVIRSYWINFHDQHRYGITIYLLIWITERILLNYIVSFFSYSIFIRDLVSFGVIFELAWWNPCHTTYEEGHLWCND